MSDATERAPLRYRDGDRVNDRYRILGELGGGGYSVVYETYDEYLDEVVALKVFAPNYGFDPVRREIQALRRLRHPNVVQVIDVGRISTDPPQWFMKLSLVPGKTLRQALDESGPLDPADVAIVGTQLLSALCEIHPDSERITLLSSAETLTDEEFAELQRLQSAGVVHRDIKPENIMYQGETITLIDFNLATPIGAMIETRSHTPNYSPSLLALERWDVFPDLHAAAVTLFELLEGRLPAQADFAMDGGAIPVLAPQGFLDFIERGLRQGGFGTSQDMLAAFEALPWEEVQATGRPALAAVARRVESAFDRYKPGDVLQGVVSSVTGFGAFVDLGEVQGLVHLSQLSWAYIHDPHDVVTVGDEVTVLVLEVDAIRSRIGLSLKGLQADPWSEFASIHRVGDQVIGEVVSLVPYGAFLALGEGIQGLVHVSELADHYVGSPADVLSVGDRISALLVDLDLVKRRIGLSIRQLAPGS